MDFRWNDWNLEHVAVHGVEIEEAEHVVEHARPLTEREKRRYRRRMQ